MSGVWIDDEGVIPDWLGEMRTEQMDSSFTPKDEANMVALVSKELLDELVENHNKNHPAKKVTAEWGGALRGTVTYYEVTFYEEDPHPDALTVGQED